MFDRTIASAGHNDIYARSDFQAAMDEARSYLAERQQFGQSIGEFQLIQAKLADLYTTMQACPRP